MTRDDRLTSRERYIFEEYCVKGGKTLKKLAEEVSNLYGVTVSSERVRQLKVRALQKLRGEGEKHMKQDTTFAAIDKLRDIEAELHRLKNALDMANKAIEAEREAIAKMVEPVDESLADEIRARGNT